jgi:hypothetical protein
VQNVSGVFQIPSSFIISLIPLTGIAYAVRMNADIGMARVNAGK